MFRNVNKLISTSLAALLFSTNFAAAQFNNQPWGFSARTAAVVSSVYAPPTLVNQYAITYGDSRTANAQGASNALLLTSSFSVALNYANGYPGWYFALSGGKILPEDSYNFGVSAQSTAGIAGRLTTTRTDCNGASATSGAACFTGLKGTLTSSGNTAGVSTINTTATPVGNAWAYEGSIAGGETVGFSPARAIYQDTILSLGSSTRFTLASPLTVAANSQVAFFSPPAATSGFASFLGAGGTGATITDPFNNYINTGIYSVETDPGQVVFVLAGTNDANLTNTQSQPQSLINLAAILDGFGPTHANKIVIIGDEVPKGLAEGWSTTGATFNGDPEFGTIGASPQTYTVANTSLFYDTQEVYYAPAGSGPPFVAGAKDGVLLTNCTTGTPAAPPGTATCTPAAGQYSVTSAGVYTFAASDAGAKIAIFYRWTSNSVGNAPNYLSLIHNWIDSSTCYTGASTGFTDPISGLQYPISGAQCNRPWVHVAPTWAAILDSSIAGNCTSGQPCMPKPYALLDGLHPQPAGGALVAQAMLATATAAGAIQSNVPYPLTTLNNLNFSGATASGTTAATYDTTLCPSIVGTTLKFFMKTLTPSISGLTQAQAKALYPTGSAIWFNGTPTAEGVTGGTVMVDCWDTTNNQIHLTAFPGQATFAGATVAHNTTNAMIQIDPTSFVSNGLFSHSIINTATAITGCGTSNVNCGAPSTGNTVTQGLPGGYGWNISLSTAMQKAITAGTLGFSYGMETNPLGDGYDAFTIQLSGYASSSSPVGTLTDLVLGQIDTIGNQVNYGDMHRAHCKISVSAGPNGRLTGLAGVQITSADALTGTFTAPGSNGASSSYAAWQGIMGGGGIAFSDGSIASGAPGVSSGVLSLDELTPSSLAATTTGTDLPDLIYAVSANAGDPVSATIRIQRCWMGKVAS